MNRRISIRRVGNGDVLVMREIVVGHLGLLLIFINKKNKKSPQDREREREREPFMCSL